MKKFESTSTVRYIGGISRHYILKKFGLAAAVLMVNFVFAQAIFTADSYSKTEAEIWTEIEESVKKLKNQFELQPDELAIIINPAAQELHLIQGNRVLRTYLVSTAKKGNGTESGSGKTPTGTHRIKEKYGDDAKVGAIFKARTNTREIAKIFKEKVDIPDDFVTTRIMWLDGQEEDLNKGDNHDSHSRYIYIHGTPEEGLIGIPASHGCIRMKNNEVIELFDFVSEGTLVEIQSKPFEKKQGEF